jgi:hypothetical protein
MAAEEKTVSEQKPKTALQVEGELFDLAVVGGDGNRVAVYNRLRAMTGRERLRLRQAISWLDDLLDQVALDLHQSRSKGGKKNAN